MAAGGETRCTAGCAILHRGRHRGIWIYMVALREGVINKVKMEQEVIERRMPIVRQICFPSGPAVVVPFGQGMGGGGPCRLVPSCWALTRTDLSPW